MQQRVRNASKVVVGESIVESMVGCAIAGLNCAQRVVYFNLVVLRSGTTTWACTRSVEKCEWRRLRGLGFDVYVSGGLWVSDAAHLA
jgi:hypothetical protein